MKKLGTTQLLNVAPATHWIGQLTLIGMLIVFWALSHRYVGFAKDGELYAIQALAKIQPGLNSDVYLGNASQDKYTIFSFIYAALIRPLALEPAELLLFTLCTVALIVAAGLIARRLHSSESAWLTAAFVTISAGQYGAYGVFSYLETYLSARSMAQALIVMAIAAFLYGWRRSATGIAAIAMLVHPIMALPGVLLLVCLSLPTHAAFLGAVCGILGTAGIALVAVKTTFGAHHMTIIDAEWLEVVAQRSQFLFMHLWHASDWELAARPFVCLTLAALVTENSRIKRLSVNSMLVGATGLAVAFVASSIGPVALLLQGQAWRWMWVTDLVSVVLLTPTVLTLWKDPKVGPLCSVLLIFGWTWTEADVDYLAFIDASLTIWLLRDWIEPRVAIILKWFARGMVALALIWSVANIWTYAGAHAADTGRDIYAKTRDFFGLGIISPLCVFALFYWTRRPHSVLLSMGSLLATLTAVALTLPSATKQIGTLGTPEEIAEFADWRSHIPANSNVLMVPLSNTASFVWLTLNRPNYTSVDQSSGVVFSRETAMEIRRRSEVLKVLGPPNWRLKDVIEAKHQNPPREPPKPIPLTAAALVSICADPQLGFVVSKDEVGFEPLKHHHTGLWNNWNLYDCADVLSQQPRA